jgi:hypothetical protein
MVRLSSTDILAVVQMYQRQAFYRHSGILALDKVVTESSTTLTNPDIVMYLPEDPV